MGGPDRRLQRRRLARDDSPECWYCGIQTAEYDTPGGGTCTPDQATIEHLVSRRNPMRHVPGSDPRRVLACFDCNNSRGHWTSCLMQEDQRLQREAYEAWNPTIAELVM
jgi:5-methylcytosine-specific restriction endonuclease McrA